MEHAQFLFKGRMRFPKVSKRGGRFPIKMGEEDWKKEEIQENGKMPDFFTALSA